MSISGTIIRRLRVNAGLTQKRLAELVGVSQAHIAKIEQLKVDPRLSTVNRILEALSGKATQKSRDIMTPGVLCAKPNDSVMRASEIMVRNGVSQLPVLRGKVVVGTITEEIIVRKLRADLASEKVENVMDEPMPVVSEMAGLDVIRHLLENCYGVLVTRNKKLLGIVTRSDLLKTLG